MTACSVCARKGILIYPVRYAIACPAGAAEAPGLSGNFRIENAPTCIGKAKYTLRALRAGYLYAYDEKRKRLNAYMVMPNGILWKFTIEHMPPRPTTQPLNNCQNPDELTFQRCIDIAHSTDDPATKLWIGWSSVVWTKALIAKVSDAVWRKKHMQSIDIGEMIAGAAWHTAEFSHHHKEIAHFGMNKAAMLKAFGFSNTPTSYESNQHGLAASIVETMKNYAPHHMGFIAAVNDPVGITNDFSELTLPTTDAGFDENIARGKIVYDLLVNTEKSVREEGRKSALFSDQMAKLSADNPRGDSYNSAKLVWQMIKAGGSANYEEKLAADKKKYGDSLVGHEDAAADQAWEAITIEEKAGRREALLDNERFNEFQNLYTKAIKAFEPINATLTRTHAEWLASEQLAKWMEGVHDASDIRSGYAYSESFSQCIGKGVSSAPCSNQLTNWLNTSTVSDSRNLYSRALLYNHDDLINATEPQLKGSDIQFENILNIYKSALLRVAKNERPKLMDRLALATANILVNALTDGSYSVMRSMAMLHLTLIGQVNITLNTSSAAELGAWLHAQAVASNVQLNASNSKVRNAAKWQAKKAISNTLQKSSVVAYEIDIAALQREALITEHTLKPVKIPGFDLTRKWLGSSAPREFHLGVVTAIVQMLALGFATQDIANEDQFNSIERNTKGTLAIIGLSSTLVDMAASTVAKTPTHPLAAFLPTQWALNADRAECVVKIAQKIGLVAGLATAAYDLSVNVSSNWADGKTLLATLYGISGILSGAVALAAYFSMAIFWPLLILSFLAGIAIAILSSTALRDWVSRCYFSKIVSDVRTATQGMPPFRPYPYTTLNDEYNAFKKAMGT
jgi:hypothetical protein